MTSINIVNNFRIETVRTGQPSNFEPIGVNLDGGVTMKYMMDNEQCYIVVNMYKKMHSYIFFELINGSPLWNFEIVKITAIPAYGSVRYYDVQFKLSVVTELVGEYLSTSLSLNNTLLEQFNAAGQFVDTNLKDKSILPFNEPKKMSANFKIKLYEYQEKTVAKMLAIENDAITSSIDYTYKFDFNGTEVTFDPITNLRCNDTKKFVIKTNGGVLADDMGLGKTISTIATIVSNPAAKPLAENISKSNKCGFNKINSRATLIVCPSHLTKQWESEIKRCDKSLTILTILTKTDYNNLKYKDIIDSDIIITSHQFLMNFKFYPALHYRACTASNYDFSERNTMIKTYLGDKLTKSKWEEVRETDTPIFEFFNFHRLVLDEGHEIFGEMLSTGTLSHYMSKWLSSIDSKYSWYVSGTPFINFRGIENCARFINLTMEDKGRGIKIDFTNGMQTTQTMVRTIMTKRYIWDQVLQKICVRHRKEDVEHQIKIPGYTERLIWLKFTDLERQLYEAKKGKVSDMVLQQLCCHPLIVESSKKIFGDVEVDLSVMQDKLIEYHKNNFETYKVKLAKLDPSRQEYNMLKKTYETQMSESKYLFTILEKMKNPEVLDQENCSICMDNLDNPAITACGHVFCYECLKMCLGDKKRCPLCKADLTGKDLMVMNMKKQASEKVNPLVEKYGSKLGKLISVIRALVAMENTRIIVFSQWDDMLSLIGKTLADNEIENCFVKGNVWSRNAAIRKFKAGKDDSGTDNKVIMLSLKNAASGTNLTEATHIFFVEPINASKEECHSIESQAIARACRVGQKQQILLMRILMENSVEETIYRRSYNQNVVVDFTEQDYTVPKTVQKEEEEESEAKPEETVEEAEVKPKKRTTKKKTETDSEEKPVKKKVVKKVVKKVDNEIEV